MNRRVLNLLAVLSLLLFLATAAMWVRSYWVADTIMLRSVSHDAAGLRITDYFGRTIQGRIRFWDGTTTIPAAQLKLPPAQARQALSREEGFYHLRIDPAKVAKFERPPVGMWEKLGFDFDRKPGQGTRFIAAVPIWAAAAATALLPALWLRRHWRRQPIPGLCPACAYNLTGNLSGVCPECGSNCS